MQIKQLYNFMQDLCFCASVSVSDRVYGWHGWCCLWCEWRGSPGLVEVRGGLRSVGVYYETNIAGQWVVNIVQYGPGEVSDVVLLGWCVGSGSKLHRRQSRFSNAGVERIWRVADRSLCQRESGGAKNPTAHFATLSLKSDRSKPMVED